MLKVKILPVSPEELRSKLEEEKKENQELHPQEIFSWDAPLRAYRKKSAGVLRFYLALALLLTLLVFFFGDRILILPIWSTLFLIYILTITPPPIIKNRITKFGIDTSGNTYRWEDLSHFFFVKRYDYELLVVVGKPPYSNHIYMVVTDDTTKQMVMKLIGEHLVYMKEPQQSSMDKMAQWLSSLMPDEEVSPAAPLKTAA